ncbi:MAG: hypothetical protein HC833_13920 [Leptolyngbyaceae cyanobacterium RM1_406_9]|nr:hypothetical protein [Leptolyngbyaceae cyanobacterium RM1_406_9]
MGKKKSLNAKRLTKKQVQELIESEGKLHEEFTKSLETTYSAGYKDQPLVYELSNDRFLLVFDPKGISIPGRGDIYSKDSLLRLIRFHQKVKEDAVNGRSSSVDHWRYYSKQKTQLVNQIDALTDDLARSLSISHTQLDFSYKSLDIVSSKAEDYGLENVQTELYDNLVAYVGEVLRRRVEGHWVVEKDYPDREYLVVYVREVLRHEVEEDWLAEEDYSDCGYPLIRAKEGELMPINVVWQELSGLEPMNLRKETANEVRRFSLRYR